jgi:tetratricopeptide (TPR) repeat protein
VELYDLGRDPGELQNIARDAPAETDRLMSDIKTWAASFDHSNSTVEVDAETAKQLRALGYFAGDPDRPEGEGRGNPVELMEVHQELQAVRELLSSGQAQEAVQRVQAALAKDPENLAGLRDLSRGLTQLGRLDEAAVAAARASAVAPWSAQARLVEADVEFQRGHHQRALDLIDQSLELDDRNLEARIERGRYLAALGRKDEAAEALESLLEESADNNWVALRYAEIVELENGDLQAAEKRLRAVLSRNPTFSEAWLLLGNAFTRAGRVSEAAAVYREAIAHDASNPELLSRLALLLAESNDPGAEKALREAIDSSVVVRPELHLALGELFAEQGRRQEAQQQFEAAATARAVSAGARNAKAMASMKLGRTGEAEAMWRSLIEDQPDYWRAWLNMSSLSIQKGAWADVERYARASVDRQPSSADAWNNLAIGLDELGRTAEAEAAYRRASEVDPNDWRALFNLGILLRVGGRYEEAAATQREVLQRAPALAGAHFELGILYAGPLGDLERAKVHLRATISADPDHPRAQQAQSVLERLP